MSPFEEEKEPDLEQREFIDEHVGFICSFEAGKYRRITVDVKVRLLGMMCTLS
jgi:hypothetical protein